MHNFNIGDVVVPIPEHLTVEEARECIGDGPYIVEELDGSTTDDLIYVGGSNGRTCWCAYRFTKANLVINQANTSLDLSKPIQTKDGRKAVILTTELKDRYDAPETVAVLVYDADGFNQIINYHKDGRHCTTGCDWDLINVKEEVNVWLVYMADTETLLDFDKEADAIEWVTDRRRDGRDLRGPVKCTL